MIQKKQPKISYYKCLLLECVRFFLDYYVISWTCLISFKTTLKDIVEHMVYLCQLFEQWKYEVFETLKTEVRFGTHDTVKSKEWFNELKQFVSDIVGEKSVIDQF